MQRIDFGLLAEAWAPRSGLERSPRAMRGGGSGGWHRPDAPPAAGALSGWRQAAEPGDAVSVLIAAGSNLLFSPSAPWQPGIDATAALLLDLRDASRHRHPGASPCSLADLERALRAQAPRLLLIDAGLAGAFGVEALRLARRASPATDWLLLWRESTPRGFELAVDCQARGCIEWDASAEQLVHALRSVLRGELWFPRQAMEWLYFSILAAAQGAAVPAAPCQFDLSSHEQRPLSEREAEALALMRQGLTNQQIAHRLGVSINTVKKHLAHVFEKRGLHHRRQLIG